MGHFDGWENFRPATTTARKQSRGARMHATPCIVTADLTIYSAAEAKANDIVGIHFASKKEAQTWVSLKQQEQLGVLRNLQRQVPYELHAVDLTGQKVKIGVYRADFTFHHVADDISDVMANHFHVVDVKGQKRREDLYKWKRKHLQIEYGLTIEEY